MYQKSTNQCYNSGTFRTYGFLLNAKPKNQLFGKKRTTRFGSLRKPL